MIPLEIRDLAVEAAGRPVLNGLTLSLQEGDKVGVVGRNGAGKTSLLKVVAGEREALAGQIMVRGRLGYLRQDPRQHRARGRRRGWARRCRPETSWSSPSA